MNVTIPASAVFSDMLSPESINVLLVLVRFIKLIISYIIFNGNNFFKNLVPSFSTETGIPRLIGAQHFS